MNGHSVDTSDLPGEVRIEQHSDFMHGLEMVQITHRLQPTVKYAGHILVTRSVLEDAVVLQDLLELAVDRRLRPWKFPDRNPMPYIDLFPRLTRAARSLKRLTLALPRLPERQVDPSQRL